MRRFVSRTHWRTTASFLASHLASPLFINIRSHRVPATVHASLRGVENHRCHVHKLAESSPASNKPSQNKLHARCRIIIKGAAVVGDIPNLRGRVRSLGQHTSSSRPGATNLFDQGYFEGVRFACNPRRNRNSSTSDFFRTAKVYATPALAKTQGHSQNSAKYKVYAATGLKKRYKVYACVLPTNIMQSGCINF